MARTVNELDAVTLMRRANLEPMENYPGAHKPWKCECLICHRIVTPHYSSVKQGRKGCAFCAGRKVDPEVAVQLLLSRNLKPLVSFPGAKTKWKSECLGCGEIVFPVYGNILAGWGGCKKCAGLKVDAAEARAIFVSKGLEPLIDYPGAHRPWLCRCQKCSNEITPRYSDVINGKSLGCVFCSGNVIDAEDATNFMRNLGFIPTIPFPGGTRKWPGVCSKCENSIQPVYSTVKYGQGICKYCSKRALSERDALKLLNDVNLKPLEPYTKAGNKILCQCQGCKREVYARLFGIIQGEGGCAYCAGRKVDAVEAKQSMINNGFEPMEEFPGSKVGWKCRCLTCGKVSKPTYGNVLGLGSGCIYCNRNGGAFDGSKPGVFYLITHKLLNAHKVGITGKDIKSDRIGVHRSEGWEVFKTLEFEKGNDALELERNILEWLQGEMNLGPYLSKADMPQGGWTETFDADEIDLPALWEKIEEFTTLG